MDELTEKQKIDTIKENAEKARAILANPDFMWLLGFAKQAEESADESLHRLLLKKGGDLLEAKILAWKVEYLHNLRTTPESWIQAEANMKKQLRKRKKDLEE